MAFKKNIKLVKKSKRGLRVTLKVRRAVSRSKSLKSKVHVKKVLHKKTSAKKLLKKVRSSVKRSTISKKILAQRLEQEALQARRLEETRKVGEMVSNKELLTTVSSSVGTGAAEILNSLVEGPKTDEHIAEKLNIKVNDVRRMLNAMNSYSIVRYDVNKDSKGWLIFTWRIDSEKLSEYVTSISRDLVVADAVLPGNCNDFFMCKSCYNKEKTVLPFDSAFESGFTCNSCGKPFALMSREETVALFKTAKN